VSVKHLIPLQSACTWRVTLVMLFCACVLMINACSEQSSEALTPEIDPNVDSPSGKGAFPPELSVYREAVERSKLPYLLIKAKPASRTLPWTSKYRGNPYRHLHEPLPTDPNGKPMALLVQINFAEAPPLQGYPTQGILQLYIADDESMQEHVWGMSHEDSQPFDAKRWFDGLQDQRFFRVLYHPNPVQDETRLEPSAPRARSFLPIESEAQLSFELKSEYVTVTDYRFEEVFGKGVHAFFSVFGDKEENVANRYIDFAYAAPPAKIGGYASFVQRDPRESAPDNDWLLLLEIQSTEESIQIMWGDVGVGGLFIRQSDLQRRDFSKVAYYWDNH
jgi:uncharacterized protein YwqG